MFVTCRILSPSPSFLFHLSFSSSGVVSRRTPPTMDSPTLLLLNLFILLVPIVSSTGVFQVHRHQRSLSALQAHDSTRHRRILSSVDLPLGGSGDPNSVGLYFAKIGLGSPTKDYYVQVDTGSDILWVNCIQCKDCKKESKLGMKLTLYNPKDSVTGEVVTCEDNFCSLVIQHPYPDCTPNTLCPYRVHYADGSATNGYYVKDYLQYNQASGNLLTSPGNATIVFGCGAKQSGDLSSDSQVDGILGFGQGNSSVISQLASSGKVKKVFSHCLDPRNGGGIFAIGQVVQPKVKSTPLVPDMPHYNINLKEIEVGKAVLDLPTDTFETTEKKGTIIDSGTTLAYLPNVVYAPLIHAILSSQPDLEIIAVEGQYQCFQYTGSVDDGFPTVTFHFEDSLALEVYPHDYMFSTFESGEHLWCVGWQNSALQSREGKDMTILGDLVLSDKLVVYDLENQVIGWTDYNCSSSIKLMDERSGAAYSIGAHDLSSASLVDINKILIWFLLFAIFI